MEPVGGQPSFIPHDAGTPTAARRTSEGGLWDLLLMLGIVALVVSCALAGGVFFYQQFLKATINSDLNKLKQARAQFDPSLVDQLTRLDNRMQSADSLLAIHIAPSAFFAALDQVTAKTVSYTSLDMEVNDPHRITLKMTGIARSVNSIAFQADLLSKSGVFTSPIFSNLDRQKDGVHFNLDAFVDTSKLNFETLVNTASAMQSGGQQPSAPVTASSSAPTSAFGGAPQSTQ